MGVEEAITDACRRLQAECGIAIADVAELEVRPLSTLFELTEASPRPRFYVLKLSTQRSCRDEFEMYARLAMLRVRSLTPVIYSDKHNYLVTRKERLTDLVTVLKAASATRRASYLRELGAFIKSLDSAAAEPSTFDPSEYLDYVEPRIASLRCLSPSESTEVLRAVRAISRDLAGSTVDRTIVTDLNLGNLHLDNDGRFVLVDMGDAYFGDVYANIVTVYLSIRFGPLQPYVERPRTTKLLFQAFMDGYGGDGIDERLFTLYELRALIVMALFIESREPALGLLARLSDRITTARHEGALRSTITRACTIAGRL